MLLPAGLKIISDQSLALSLRPRRNIRRDLENKHCKVSALNFKSLGFSSLRSLRKPTIASTNSSPTPTRQRCPRLGQGVVDERKERRVWIDCAWEDSEPKPILLFSGSDLERKYHYLQWVWWSQRKETLWVDSQSSDLERTSLSRVCSVEANRPGGIHGASGRPSLIPQNTMREHPKVSVALWSGCGREWTDSLQPLGTMAVRLDSHRVTPMDLTDGGQGSLEMSMAPCGVLVVSRAMRGGL